LTIIATAKVIDVDAGTVGYWENEGGTPRTGKMPNIISFLGYNPYDRPKSSFAEKVRAHRKELGLSYLSYSLIVGLDHMTISRVEQGRRIKRKTRAKLEEYFSN